MNELDVKQIADGLDLVDYTGTGYKPAVKFGAWRVAYINYSDAFDAIKKIERHMETDEVFMLLEGSATLIIGEEKKKIEMIAHKVYNVRQAVWHAIKLSKDAKVFVAENDDTTVDNTEYIYFDEPIA